MLDETALEFSRIDGPDFLEPDADFLRLPAFLQSVTGEQLLCQRAARAFGDERVFAAKLHAAGEAGLRLAVAADSHIACGYAEHFAAPAGEAPGRSDAGIDFTPKRFRFGGHPFRRCAERADEFSVVA